ncbi:MAG: biopolymer transporter ExbD [Myxococcales bacterium]|nr:biopolymer transporter ExbD [Myxococcales bacterium]MDD9970720.1 biopolymer transporter ExbD [Myxococcales bacterium]
MGGISVGGGHGGKKAVDTEVALIPVIDLLLCCVMFLLVTAVWNQLARIDANQQQPGQNAPDQPPPEEKIKLVLQVSSTGYVLSSTAGDRVEIPKVADAYDESELRAKLKERHQMEPNRKDLVVAPEDGVLYGSMIDAMDVVLAEGFSQMSVSDGAAL